MREGTARELDAAAELVVGWLEQRAALLGNGADVLVGDFGFRTAIASGDRETIASSLENNAARIGADVAVLYAPGGQPLVASVGRGLVVGPGAGAAVGGRGNPDVRDEALMTLGDTAWQNVVVPVRAPLTIGRLLFGFALDADVAVDLARQAGMQVSVGTFENGAWRHGVTVRGDRAPTLDEAALNAVALSDEAQLTELAGVPFMVRTVAPDAGGSVRIVLQRSLADALAPYHALRARLLATTGGALLLGLLAAAWMAHGVSRPIGALTHAARARRRGQLRRADRHPARRRDRHARIDVRHHALRGRRARGAHRAPRRARRDHGAAQPARAAAGAGGDVRGVRGRRARTPTPTPTARPTLLLVADWTPFERTVETLGDRVGESLVVELARRLRAHAGPSGAVAPHRRRRVRDRAAGGVPGRPWTVRWRTSRTRWRGPCRSARPC